jgi:glycosyltransferase involved in cell wall biosynthesis
LITIVIPTYNRAAIISKTIDSFIAQTFEDWEMIVVDDHSKDNTNEVIEGYHKQDARISYLLNERKKGAQGARNTGILHAKTEWIICFDSDNEAHPDMLEKLTEKISDNVDVVSCFSNVIDEKTKQQIGKFEWVSEGDIHRNLFAGSSYVDFNQAIIRKSKLLEIGLLDEDCPSMQEWDTHIRLSKIARYTTVREHLVDYYVNGEDAISTDKKREVRGHLYVFGKHKDEWKEDRENLKWMIGRTYAMIRLNSDYVYRLKALMKLARITPYTIQVVLKKRLKFLKRILNVKRLIK